MRMAEKPTVLEWQNALAKLDATAKHAGLWKSVFRFVSKPRRSRVSVNLNKLNKIAKENELVIVPGKVLGFGIIDHKFHVAAVEYSAEAMEKLNSKGCKIITLKEAMKNESPRIVI